MSTKTYSSELEASFRIYRPFFEEFFTRQHHSPKHFPSFPPYLSIAHTDHIEQLWTSNITPTNSNLNVRTRIRRTETLTPSHSPKTTYEATTKYERANPLASVSFRTEINSPLTSQEYHLILRSSGMTPVHKTRIYFYDLGTDITGLNEQNHPMYSVDFYPETDPQHDYVTLEIEFANQGDAQDYTPPEWLVELLKKTREKTQSGGQKHE